ncbi:polyhomeotic-like protein 1 [Scyliorhinus canicula]|uniref:polyhomeotic-like protein 1 n=1 Tax=Scyliorhinus canicula TaxID=7830 RepID=UPI0018F7C948|nr:polyhomeotic-like protein 1 [Scyliorhinus canicula]
MPGMLPAKGMRVGEKRDAASPLAGAGGVDVRRKSGLIGLEPDQLIGSGSSRGNKGEEEPEDRSPSVRTAMDNENEQNASPVSGSGSSNGTSGNPRPQVSQMSLYERQAVQALQALQRQPNAAAQYLQQMYAVQHQHMMLQQHLNTAQLQSLAAVQQTVDEVSTHETRYGTGSGNSF